MENKYHNLGFSANYPPNTLKISVNPMQVRGVVPEYGADTDLRLDSPGSTITGTPLSKGTKRKWSLIDKSMGQHAGSSLSLGLGRSSSSPDSKGSSVTACTTMSSAKETDEESSMDLELDFSLNLGNEKMPSPKKSVSSNFKGPQLHQKVDLELSLSTGPSESDITTIIPGSAPLEFSKSIACGPTSIVPDLSSSVITAPKSSVTCTSGITQRQSRNSISKLCQIEGCGKRARGASGRCISHGGGRRCQKQGCHKGAEGRTVYCKAHGGGRRCEFLGCTKSAEGRTDYCIAHGGGRRCSHEGCTRAARGKSGLCIRHGGGKRCWKENCTRSAEGLSGLCISHGGGRRCQATGCTKGAQGSTMFCKAHGGGKRCTALGCTKGAEGSTPFCKGHGGGKRCAFQGGGVCTKSIHGGTSFCVAHGGGKRCGVPECTKSARGRTDYCVRHGGGKRCKSEGCGKSAQGSTDFCKAHGGGKRCSWGNPVSEHGVQTTDPCNLFARGETGLCALHSGLVQDKRVHGGVTLGPMIHDPKAIQTGKMKQVAAVDDMNVDITGDLMASSSKAAYLKHLGASNSHIPVPVLVPEGRVHGGSLMALLAGGSGIGSSSNQAIADDSSDPRKHFMIPESWK